jgi:hypothetical protein
MPTKQVKQRRPSPAKRAAAAPVIAPSADTGAGTVPSPEDRRRMIADAAYFRAERRGFAAGGELDDWLAAEGEIDRLIERGGSQSRHAARHM